MSPTCGMEGSSKARKTWASASTVRSAVRNAVSLSASWPMAATSAYSTTACVSILGLYWAARRSRRSSGTLAMPRCASRGLECPRAETSTLVRILNSDVLPTCGRPMIPVFMGLLLALGLWLLVRGSCRKQCHALQSDCIKPRWQYLRPKAKSRPFANCCFRTAARSKPLRRGRGTKRCLPDA